MRRLWWSVLMAWGLLAVAAEAQRLGPAPKRPRTAAIEDTNSARSYFNAGVDAFEHDAEGAATAFYWSARIDPGS